MRRRQPETEMLKDKVTIATTSSILNDRKFYQQQNNSKMNVNNKNPKNLSKNQKTISLQQQNMYLQQENATSQKEESYDNRTSTTLLNYTPTSSIALSFNNTLPQQRVKYQTHSLSPQSNKQISNSAISCRQNNPSHTSSHFFTSPDNHPSSTLPHFKNIIFDNSHSNSPHPTFQQNLSSLDSPIPTSSYSTTIV